MNIKFSGKIWFWRGPSPYFFVTVPAKQCRDLKVISELVTYGWGMIPVTDLKIGLQGLDSHSDRLLFESDLIP